MIRPRPLAADVAGLTGFLPPELLKGGAITILVSTVIYAFIRAWLVPGPIMDRILAQEQRRGDEWMATAQAATARADELTGQMTELLELGHTTVALLSSLRAPEPAALPKGPTG